VVADVLVKGVGQALLVLPLLANGRLWHGLRRRGLADLIGVRPGRRPWVAGYVRNSFVAALVTYAAAPTTVMWWQGVSLLHAAVLPLVLWGGVWWRRRAKLAARVAW